jgi:hypothetical protein
VTVDVADADGQAAGAAGAHERRGLGGIGQRSVRRLCGQVLVALDATELGLDRDAERRQLLRHGGREGQVLLVGQARAVGEHGVDSGSRGAPDQLAVGRVVELHQHRHTRLRGGGVERGEQALAALRSHRAGADQDDHRRAALLRRSHHRLELEQVVTRERAHGTTRSRGLRQHRGEARHVASRSTTSASVSGSPTLPGKIT